MRKTALYLAGSTGAVLVVMVIVMAATGVTQEPHEHFLLPEAYALGLVEHGPTLRIVFALDVAFIAMYTAFFAAFAAYLRERGRPFAMLAFGAMALTALLDLVEDHHILTLLDAAEQRVLPSVGALAFQSVLSACKFSVSYISLVLFGLAVPRTTRLGWALSMFLVVGTLFTAVLGYALAGAARASFEQGRGLGFLVGFALAIAWLLKDRE